MNLIKQLSDEFALTNDSLYTYLDEIVFDTVSSTSTKVFYIDNVYIDFTYMLDDLDVRLTETILSLTPNTIIDNNIKVLTNKLVKTYLEDYVFNKLTSVDSEIYSTVGVRICSYLWCEDEAEKEYILNKLNIFMNEMFSNLDKEPYYNSVFYKFKNSLKCAANVLEAKQLHPHTDLVIPLKWSVSRDGGSILKVVVMVPDR